MPTSRYTTKLVGHPQISLCVFIQSIYQFLQRFMFRKIQPFSTAQRQYTQTTPTTGDIFCKKGQLIIMPILTSCQNRVYLRNYKGPFCSFFKTIILLKDCILFRIVNILKKTKVKHGSCWKEKSDKKWPLTLLALPR